MVCWDHASHLASCGTVTRSLASLGMISLGSILSPSLIVFHASTRGGIDALALVAESVVGDRADAYIIGPVDVNNSISAQTNHKQHLSTVHRIAVKKRPLFSG